MPESLRTTMRFGDVPTSVTGLEIPGDVIWKVCVRGAGLTASGSVGPHEERVAIGHRARHDLGGDVCPPRPDDSRR